MNTELNFYMILDKVVDDVHVECGYVNEGENSMPAVIVGEDVTFYEDITEARAAYWAKVGR